MDMVRALAPGAAASEWLRSLPTSGRIDAVVSRVLGGDSYLLEVLGRSFEVTSRTPLELGAALSLQIERGDAGATLLRVLPPGGPIAGSDPAPPAGAAASSAIFLRGPESVLERLGLPPSPGRLQVAQALLDHGVPATADNFSALERFAGAGAAPARVQAGALLLSRGVTDLAAAGDPLARFLEFPLEIGRAVARAESAALAAGASSATPATDLRAGLQRISAAGLTRLESAVQAEVARLLAADPLLATLDRLLTRLPTPGAGTLPSLPPELQAAIDAALTSPRPDSPEVAALLQKVADLDPPVREAVAAALNGREREALDRLPALTALRQGLAAVHEVGDRAGAVQLLNVLHEIRGEQVRILEVPLTLDARPASVALRIQVDDRNRGAGSPGAGGGMTSVFLRTEMSVLGLISAVLRVQGRTASVAFRVRDESARRRLGEGAAELVAALAELDFATRVVVDVREPEEDDWISWLLGVPAGPRTGLDVQA